VMAGTIAATEIVTKILIYYFHERAWAWIAPGAFGCAGKTPVRHQDQPSDVRFWG
jgi:uncharacterized membrane protein